MALFEGRFINNIVVLTGAGISAESGISTFRDANGLWENHDPLDVATPEAFARDPQLVYRFYNERRQQLRDVEPNAAHRALAELQAEFQGQVFLVTQNVDDLHERAGSAQTCHMHGELNSMLCNGCNQRMSAAEVFDHSTDCPSCRLPGALRPDIVWFGEMPYFMADIEARLLGCDLFLAIGTSGAVYPAAGFVRQAAMHGAACVEINLQPSDVAGQFHHHRTGPASREVPAMVASLLA
jgi:NAD-dependent protein deacetylase/lipoamidase